MMIATALDTLFAQRVPYGFGGRFYGVYTAIVSDNDDPDGQGRVRIRLPWSPDSAGTAYEAWARLATMMAGNERGSWFIPDVDDEVLICFEAGDVRHPYVVGMLWNGQDAPPQSMQSGNNIKQLRSRSGIEITLDDSSGQETLTLKTPGGQTVTLQDGATLIELRDSGGNSVKLEASGITVNASAKVTINASTVEVSAGMVTVNAGMSKFSGVVQADTVITNSVVSASYTPGAGNIW